MESHPHHGHDHDHGHGHDGMTPSHIRTVRDGTHFAMKVIAPFDMEDLEAIPIGSHVLVLLIDPSNGRALELDGSVWTEERMTEARADNADAPEGAKFSGTLIYVAPTTLDERENAANEVIAALDLGNGIPSTVENAVAAFRSGWLSEDSLLDMLGAAAAKGRNL